MKTSTASTDGANLFDTPFSIAATVVSVVLLLAGVVVLWTGYQESALPVVGTELTILTGVVGFMFAVFFGIGALIVAAFMEPGFDR